MSFIAILCSIFIELGLKALESWRRFDWFDQLTDWILLQMKNTRVPEGPVTLIAVLAPVVILAWILAALLSGVWILFAFAFSVFVLSMSLGPHDPLRLTQEYLAALENNDLEAARINAELMLGNEPGDNQVSTAQDVKEKLFIKLVTNILGVFFWFIILGPVGAVLFRANCLLKNRYEGVQNRFADSINDLHRILIWIPARLAVIGFAVTGSFVHTLDSLNHFSDLWKMDSEKLLIECGLGALSSGVQVEENQPDLISIQMALALSKRTVIAWLTVLGILVIAGWLG